jgi:hypothetical protein
VLICIYSSCLFPQTSTQSVLNCLSSGCAVQEKSAALPSRVFPVWSTRPYCNRLKLTGFQTVSFPVLFALTRLDFGELLSPDLMSDGSPFADSKSSNSVARQPGVLDEVVRELVKEYGSHNEAIKVATGAGMDAIRCCNAFYSYDEGHGQLVARHVWDRRATEDYIKMCWYAYMSHFACRLQFSSIMGLAQPSSLTSYTACGWKVPPFSFRVDWATCLISLSKTSLSYSIQKFNCQSPASSDGRTDVFVQFNCINWQAFRFSALFFRSGSHFLQCPIMIVYVDVYCP